jgi:hypothetical protein
MELHVLGENNESNLILQPQEAMSPLAREERY